MDQAEKGASGRLHCRPAKHVAARYRNRVRAAVLTAFYDDDLRRFGQNSSNDKISRRYRFRSESSSVVLPATRMSG
jgi:hypothetical protein